MAGFMKLCIFLFVAVMFLTMVSAQGGRGRGGNRGGGSRGGGGRGGGGRGGNRGNGLSGGRGRMYRSVNYGDDEAYGYDSAFPGEAAYASYKPSEVRAKRAPEFPGSAPYPSFGSQGAEGQELGGIPEAPDMAQLY